MIGDDKRESCRANFTTCSWAEDHVTNRSFSILRVEINPHNFANQSGEYISFAAAERLAY